MPAVELGGRIYVPGGFGGERVLEAYDPARDMWEELPSLPAARHHLMATAHGGQLYVFGGGAGLSFNATDDAWVFDPASRAWR
ncbi:MAG TPA: kelch repeat-containing protein, partial [Anaerolineales bacterium]